MPYSRLLTFFLLFLLWTTYSVAKPYTPESNDAILETVEVRVGSDFQELKALQDEVGKTPDDSAIAVKLFNKYMSLAAKTGEPYYSGRAEALLNKWLDRKTVPDNIRVASATIKQYNHDFSGAEQELNQVVTNNPKNLQARLLRSNIYRITGRYKEARQDCVNMALLGDPVIVSVCQLSISTLTGKARWSVEKLEELIKRDKAGEDKNTSEWKRLVLAEALASIGEYDKALQYLKEIDGDLNKTSINYQAVYADILIQQKKYQEAYDFLSSNQLPEATLLRRAIAAKKLNLPETDKLSAILKSRFDDSARAGRAGHLREEALFELYLGSPDKALTQALKNWSTQKELIDTRIVLEAALKSKQYAKAKEVADWITQKGTEDFAIKNLVKEIGEKKL